MGKFGPRLSSRKKAKRWPKGQSSSSNPETRKYRNQARSGFFHQNVGMYLQFFSIASFLLILIKYLKLNNLYIIS